MRAFLDTFSPSVAGLAERIRQGDSSAFELIPTMADSLQEVANFLEALSMLNRGNEDPYGELARKLLAAGRLANEGLSSGDLGLVADTLEYEICAGLDALRQQIAPK
jgi:hypothetical protein